MSFKPFYRNRLRQTDIDMAVKINKRIPSGRDDPKSVGFTVTKRSTYIHLLP